MSFTKLVPVIVIKVEPLTDVGEIEVIFGVTLDENV